MNGKSQPPNLSSFRIDRKMLPESPETFMRNWDNSKSAGLSATKSPIREINTIKKEPVMIHHNKGKSEHEQKPTTPEKMRSYGNNNPNNSSNDIMEKINEGKEIYRNNNSNYYGDGDLDNNNSNNPNNSNGTMFIYECGHCLSGNMKGGGPNPRKINSLCPGCMNQKGSGNKWNGSGGKNKGMI